MPLSIPVLLPPWATKRLLPLTLLLQTALVLLVFSKLIFHPGEYLIVDHYDGMKSYFSMESFLRQPMSSGTVVQGHNYPFGEYIYYTDSTPLVIVPLHALVQAVPALQPYGLYLYDLFVLSGLIISAGLVYLISRLLTLPAWLAVALSLALPWLCPQTIRLQVGHMSLAYTPAILLSLWVLLKLYLAHATQQTTGRWYLALGGGIVAVSYLHFYYLAILGALAGFFFVFWSVREAGARRPWVGLLVKGCGTLLLAAVVTMGLLMLLDGRYAQRPVAGGGYDWIEWKLQFGAFFRGYGYNSIRFPLERTAGVPYEASAYLTAFGLYGGLLIALLALARRLPAVARPLPMAMQGWVLLLLASVPLVSIALGETYMLDNDTYVLHNYTNPFLWLHQFTDRVAQFRVLGRFVWPFWWVLLLGYGWYVAHWQQHRLLRWVLPGLLLLLALDTRDALRFYRDFTQRDNLLTAAGPTEPMRRLVAWFNPARYQAILPLPLYHVGAEPSPIYTTDPDDPHCNRTYQLASITHLPLMSNKAARTPPEQARLIMSVLQPGGPDPALLRQMDNRPVLVFLDTAYYDGSNNYYRETLKDRADMRTLFERTPDFIREQHLKFLRRQGSWSLYEWYPNGNPQ